MGRNALKNQQCQLLANFSKNIQSVNIKPCFSKAFPTLPGVAKTSKKCPYVTIKGHLSIQQTIVFNGPQSRVVLDNFLHPHSNWIEL